MDTSWTRVILAHNHTGHSAQSNYPAAFRSLTSRDGLEWSPPVLEIIALELMGTCFRNKIIKLSPMEFYSTIMNCILLR